MIFSSALLAILATVSVIGAHGRGQIPIVGGVHGGVPSAASAASERLKSSATTAVTAGVLRVVENSGVCGAFSSTWSSAQLRIDRISMANRNHTRRVPSLGIR